MKLFRINVDHDSRIWGLDLMRAVAILLVVFHHMRWITVSWPGPLRKALYGSGILGVELFFVLSGYLIGGILYKLSSQQNSISTMVSFWRKRWYRTLPLYFLILSVIVITYLGLGIIQFKPEIFNYYFFLQNFMKDEIFFFPDSWSLSVEEWTYLLTPFVILLIPSRGKNAFLLKTMGLIVFYTAIKYVVFYYNVFPLENWNTDVREVVLFRLDSILYGFLVLFGMKNYPQFFFKWRIPMFVAGLAGIVLSLLLYGIHIGSNAQRVTAIGISILPLFSFSIAFIIPFMVHVKRPVAFIARPVTVIALISYSTYLIHNALIVELARRYYGNYITGSAVISIPVYIAMIVVIYWLSVLSYKYIEMPILRIRDKKEKVKATSRETIEAVTPATLAETE